MKNKTKSRVASLRALVAGLVVVSIVVGCSVRSDNHEDTKTMQPFGADAVLSEKVLKTCVQRASKGDAEAAYRLYAHYGIGVGDAKNAQKYFDQAVALEYPAALYAHAVHLWDEHSDPAMVLRYLKRALELGNPDSSNLLLEVEAALKAKS